MAAPIPSATDLSVESAKSFLIEKGGQVTHKEFARHFKNLLTASEDASFMREEFKRIAHELTRSKDINGEKYVILRKKFMPKEEISDDESEDIASEKIEDSDSKFAADASRDEVVLDPVELLQQESTTGLASDITQGGNVGTTDPVESSTTTELPKADADASQQNITNSELNETSVSQDEGNEVQVNGTPVAPPRKKHSQKWKRDVSEEEKTENISENDAADLSQSINVKEQAKKLNKIVSESQLTNRATGNAAKKRENKLNDEDDNPTFPLNAATREWIVKAAKSDYMALIGLLKDNSGLAKYKDFIWGYNALHWAAKRGNCDVIKLIAGTHGVDVNIRSNGGLTPLHLAAMFQRKAAYDLLMNTYKANTHLRDFSGKRAIDYWKKLEPKKSTRTASSSSNSSKPNYNPSKEDHAVLVRSTSTTLPDDEPTLNLSDRATSLANMGTNSPSLSRRLRNTSVFASFRKLNRPKVAKQPQNPYYFTPTYRPIAQDQESTYL